MQAHGWAREEQLDVAVSAGADSVLDEVESLLAGVEDALRRLEEGTYGRCERCGAPIAEEVLARDPLGRDCGGHALAAKATSPEPDRVVPVTGSGADPHPHDGAA